jgi:predicted NAD/FAD-binding protein
VKKKKQESVNLMAAGFIATTVLVSYFTQRSHVNSWLKTTFWHAKQPLYTQIEKVSTIKDVIDILVTIAKENETDELVDMIVNEVRDHPLSEASLIRISDLHQEFGISDGREGFAINVLWSSIIYSINQTDTD